MAWVFERGDRSMAVAIAFHMGAHLDNTYRAPAGEVRLEWLRFAVLAIAAVLAAWSLCTQRPDFAWAGASCHDADELCRAGELGLDYALLGPVLPTPTHPDATGLGWAKFARLITGTPLPVFALGGMKNAMLAAAQEQGAHGIALMRGW